jgi:hypothetical protein
LGSTPQGSCTSKPRTSLLSTPKQLIHQSACAARFRPQGEAPGDDDELAGLHAIEHVERLDELHGPCREVPLAALDQDVDDVAVAHGPHSGARHERDVLIGARLDVGGAPAPGIWGRSRYQRTIVAGGAISVSPSEALR